MHKIFLEIVAAPDFDDDALEILKKKKNLRILKQAYPFIKTGSIGKSIMGKDIPFVRIGRGQKEVFYSASYHANEWITSVVLMKFVEDYANAYFQNGKLYNYSVRDLFNNVSIFIMPMVNPDGVDLVTGNILPSSSAYNQAKSIANNYPDIPFPSGWKANIRGVDLNLQFPAGWQQARATKYSQGFTRSSSS